jgi:UMF1 family MFS transporter
LNPEGEAMNPQTMNKKEVWSWALYDWANSAFATTVMAGFFPLFFKEYWSAGLEVTRSTFALGAANSIPSLVIVLLAPLLGAIADRSGRRKRFLAVFALMGIGLTAALFLVDKGHWQLAALLYALATIGFAGSLIFYDALLVSVARPERYDAVSAFGFAMGYVGGGVLFAVNVAMVLSPGWFGLSDEAEAVRWSFVTVSLWWLLFSTPLMLWVREPAAAGEPAADTIRAGFRQLRATFREVRRLRVVFYFLLAYWFYIDAVDTIVRMAVDYGLSIGLESNSLITALLLTQFVGFPAALLFGHFGARFGAKRGIYVGLAVYVGVVLWASQMETEAEFYALAVVIGLVQGGVQALSRSLYARLIPPEKCAEFFGFFNMLGKFAAVIGPVLVGWTSAMTGEPRLSLLVLLILFALGAFFLGRVNVAEGRRMAAQL